MRRALFITGSRSDYDIQRGILRALREAGEVEAQLIVTGAHLAKTHGETFAEIFRDNLAMITKLPSWVAGDTKAARAKNLANQITALADLIPDLKPDLILVPMDREEALAIATAGAYLDLPLFHLGGGDITGDGIDDRTRHAVSRFAHVHLTHTAAASARLVAQGEASWRVHQVGAPGLDRWRETPRLTKSGEPYAVLIQHPNFGSSQEEASVALEALRQIGIPVWVGDPNSDPQRELICALNREFCARFPQQFQHYGNLAREPFQKLLIGATVLVGNSSCGIVEAPYLKVPTVDLGRRQQGRDRASNVTSVPYELTAIVAAINRAAFDPQYRRELARTESPYGDGHAGEKIARLLAEIPLDQRLLQKEYT